MLKTAKHLDAGLIVLGARLIVLGARSLLTVERLVLGSVTRRSCTSRSATS
jgi:nucleotide-binding universal stress UspA family protein